MLENKIIISPFFLILLVIALIAINILPAKAESGANLTVGAQHEGFTLTEIGRHESLNADVYLWRHDKTGAQTYFFLNDDPDMTFANSFRTEPTDNTGMLHILEHISCSSSEKYPARSLLVDVMSQSYITDVNAGTYKSATNYYVSSMSEDQVEVMADFFLDAAFNGSILTDANHFKREGWRYEMASADADLTINGIVYNEMQGAYGNITRLNFANSDRVLAPDTYQGLDSGGAPDQIPNLTYEALVDFYKKAYHPSNSISLFYGALDMNRFLKLLNSYFSEYDQAQPSPKSPEQAPFKEPIVARFEFPVAADDTETNSDFAYVVALDSKNFGDYADIASLTALTSMIGDNSSPLMQALNASGIASGYFTFFSPLGTQPVIYFYAQNGDATRAEEFKTIVFDNLQTMIESGLDAELRESLFANLKFEYALARNQSGAGVSLADNLGSAVSSGHMEALNPAPYFDEAHKRCQQERFLENMLRSAVLENPHAALVITEPVRGLLEKNQAAQRENLAKIKAAMSAEEIEKITRETAEFAVWSENITPESTLEKIHVVDPAKLELKLPEYALTNEVIQGISTHTADVESTVAKYRLSFDLEHLTLEETQQFILYASLLGASTANRSQQEVSVQSGLLLYRLSADINARGKEGRRSLDINFYAMDENIDQAAELVLDMGANIDIAANSDLLAKSISAKLQPFTNAESLSGDIAKIAVLADSEKESRIMNNLYGMDLRDFLRNCETRMKNDPETFIAEMNVVRVKAFTPKNASLYRVGSSEKRAASLEAFANKISALSGEPGQAVEFDALETYRRIGFSANTTSVYVRQGLNLGAINQETNGAMMILAKMMGGEYLIPEFRYKGGAYGAGMAFNQNKNRFALSYYRGDNYTSTLEKINALPDVLENMPLTQEITDSYKLTVISELTMPLGPLNMAMQALINEENGYTPAMQRKLLEETQSATIADMKALVPTLRAILDNASYVVTASAEMLSQTPELFDKVY